MKRMINAVAVLVTLLTVAAAGMVPATASPRQPRYLSVQCATRSKTYDWGEAGTWPILGSVRLSIEVCTDGISMTSTYASHAGDSTSTADALGWVSGWYNPTRVAFNSGSWGTSGVSDYHVDGYAKLCSNHWVPVGCSLTEHAREVGVVHMLPWYYTKTNSSELWLNGRLFYWTWDAYCTNSVCRMEFV